MKKTTPILFLFTSLLCSQTMRPQDAIFDSSSSRHRCLQPSSTNADSSQNSHIRSQNETKITYQLKWQDEFSGDLLDETNNWKIEVNGNGGGNNELQYYRRENIAVGKEPISGESCLIITGKKQSYLNKTCTSGRLTTQNKMSFQYGKLEARIKLPKTANGLWPAFWLLGHDIATLGWPKCGEIDILEMGNSAGIKANTQDKLFNGACHWGYFENGWYPNYAKATTNLYSLQDDFHLYTIVWNASTIKMYLDQDKYPDAKPYYEIAITDKSTDKGTFYYFNKPFFVIFNLAIGGNFPGIFDINQISALSNGDAKMYVDYVRLYQSGEPDEDFEGKITDVKQAETKNELEIYPNPAENQVFVCGDQKPYDLSLFDTTGRLVKKSRQTVSLNTSNLPMGHYLLKVTDAKGRTETHKLVKKNK